MKAVRTLLNVLCKMTFYYLQLNVKSIVSQPPSGCLLYTSDAADDWLVV